MHHSPIEVITPLIIAQTPQQDIQELQKSQAHIIFTMTDWIGSFHSQTDIN